MFSQEFVCPQRDISGPRSLPGSGYVQGVGMSEGWTWTWDMGPQEGVDTHPHGHGTSEGVGYSPSPPDIGYNGIRSASILLEFCLSY